MTVCTGGLTAFSQNVGSHTSVGATGARFAAFRSRNEPFLMDFDQLEEVEKTPLDVGVTPLPATLEVTSLRPKHQSAASHFSIGFDDRYVDA